MSGIHKRDRKASPAEGDAARAAKRLGRYFFEVEGIIDGVAVQASFGPEGLSCHWLLRSYAELAVALGETFTCGRRALPASLEGSPGQVLLTLVRCMEVTNIHVCLDEDPFDDPAPPRG